MLFSLEPRGKKILAHIFHIMRVTSGNDVIEVEVDFIPPSQDTFYSPIKEFEIG